MKLVYYLARGGCLACALTAGAAVAAPSCNKQPVQPQSTQAIGRDMIVNGVPTSVVGVQFAGTPNDVSRTFSEFWKDEGVSAKSQNTSSGLLLSALDGQCLYVLSVPSQRDSARTRGLMSVIRLGNDPVAHRVPDSAVPMPEDSKVISDVESRDPGQTGRTWLLDMPGEARWNAKRYQNSLSTQGWSSVGHQPDFQSGGAQSAQGTAFGMQHGRDSVDVSFSDRDGRTFAVINATRNR